jgi:hypothetical protein
VAAVTSVDGLDDSEEKGSASSGGVETFRTCVQPRPPPWLSTLYGSLLPHRTKLLALQRCHGVLLALPLSACGVASELVHERVPSTCRRCFRSVAVAVPSPRGEEPDGVASCSHGCVNCLCFASMLALLAWRSGRCVARVDSSVATGVLTRCSRYDCNGGSVFVCGSLTDACSWLVNTECVLRPDAALQLLRDSDGAQWFAAGVPQHWSALLRSLSEHLRRDDAVC